MPILDRFDPTSSVTESGLLILSAVVVVLFVVALLFSVYAVMLRWRHARRDSLWERLRERWERPVLTAITDPDRIGDAQALVPRKYRLHFVQFVLEYTRRVRGQERGTLRLLVEPYLEEIAKRASHRRPEIRTRAIQTLGALGLPRYSKEVLAGLEDPSPLVSMVAARSLARPDFPEFASAVLEQLYRFDGWNRRFLASMLAEMGPEVSPVLRDGLLDETLAPWLRTVYADALGAQLDPRAADVAVEALEEAEGRDLVASLLRLLSAVGRPEHVPAVRARCDSDNVVIRAQALHALGVLGDATHLPILLSGMDDPSPWAALHAARGVRDAGGADLLKRIAGSDDPQARIAGQVLFEEGGV